MNKADSNRLAGKLEGLGLRPTDDVQQADIVVVNSCAVRQSAEERVYSKLGWLKDVKKQRPRMLVALMGCMVGPERQVQQLRRRLPHVDLFLRPLEEEPLLAAVRQRLSEVKSSEPDLLAGGSVQMATPGGAPQVETVGSPTRWVPIIYGCDRFCTYCIVPHRRGRERSRPFEEIVEEVKQFVGQGAIEVTLLGQIVDRYGFDLPGRPDLGDLLTELNSIAGLQRIRFLTSHPSDMTDKVIQAVARLPKVCEHINLPVQSGDDEVLRRMERGYTVEEYRRLVARIRDAIPAVSLATDVIVGFPGETAEQFEHTIELLQELRFDVVHVAMYSPRPGTKAARWEDDVPSAVKRERLQRVEALQEQIAAEINAAYVGKRVEILIEGRSKGKWQGRTRTNKLVFCQSQAGDGIQEDLRAGDLVDVSIQHASPWALQGIVCRIGASERAPNREHEGTSRGLRE